MGNTSIFNGLSSISIDRTDYRIRLPGDLARLWGAEKAKNDQFDLTVYFRTSGELHCIADWGYTAEEGHPFSDLEGYPFNGNQIERRAGNVPSARALLAPARFHQCKAKWTQERKQLDLNVGKAVCGALHDTGQAPSKIHLVPWGPLLVIISARKFAQISDEQLRPIT